MFISYPTDIEVIRNFFKQNEAKYVGRLKHVKDLLMEGKRNRKELRCIYNIYSRGDKQGGIELKQPHKIHMKFDEWCKGSNPPGMNIVDLPDIVGITIAVVYPSDINTVCKFVDSLCEEGKLFAFNFDKHKNDELNKKTLIKLNTVFGSIKDDHDYFACHYATRVQNNKNEPIIEIQVKTVLYDAWGLKTHDLTYKNPFEINSKITKNFSVLGRTLLNIDVQSEYLRQLAYEDYAFREKTKRSIRIEMAMVIANATAESVSKKSDEPAKYIATLREVRLNTKALSGNDIANMRNKAVEFCDSISDECGCALLSALAAITEDVLASQDAIDYLSIWGSREKMNAKPRINLHLAHYDFGNIVDAIAAATEAGKVIEDIIRGGGYGGADSRKILGQKLGVNSSLSYYYAELIGTDDGKKKDAYSNSHTFRERTKDVLHELGVISDRSKGWAELIEELLSLLKGGKPVGGLDLEVVFNVIDNAIFVEIQRTDSVIGARQALDWLDRLRDARPNGGDALVLLSHDLHKHCARMRLLELQSQEAAGS